MEKKTKGIVIPMAVEQNHYFRIDADGKWFHNDAPINRAALARLFADKGLKIDGDGNYWMQSPFEKYPVEVEDVPFVIVDFQENEGGVDLISNMDERVEIGKDSPLELRYSRMYDMKLPYVQVRDGLYARIGRSMYYALVEKFGSHLQSRGQKYPLGEMDE